MVNTDEQENGIKAHLEVQQVDYKPAYIIVPNRRVRDVICEQQHEDYLAEDDYFVEVLNQVALSVFHRTH